MNIALMIGTNNWTGAEQHVEYLARGLAERGHNVYIVCRTGTIIESKLKRDFRILSLPMKNAVDLFSILRLALFLIKNKIEIVHTHHNKVGWIAIFAAKMAGIKKVFNTRHMVPYNIKRDCLHRWYMNSFCALICPSEFARDLYMEAYPRVRKGKFVAVANGTIDCMTAHGFSEKSDRVNLLSIGRLSPDKGTDTLLKAISILKQSSVRLRLVGEYDKNFQDWARTFISENNIENMIEISGFSSNVCESLSKADIFVLPSSTPESGGPMSMLEAMSCGVPVIVSNNGSQKEIIKDGENGILVDPGDANGLANAIKMLVADREKRTKIAVNARKTYLEKFTIRSMVEAMERVYSV